MCGRQTTSALLRDSFFIPLRSAKAFLFPRQSRGLSLVQPTGNHRFPSGKRWFFRYIGIHRTLRLGFPRSCRLLTNLSKRKRSAYTKAILPSLCVLFSSLKNTGAALPVSPVTLMYSADYFDIKMIRINKKAPTFQSRLLCFLVPPSLSGGVSLSASTHAA